MVIGILLVWTATLSGALERSDPLEGVQETNALQLQVVPTLKIQPESFDGSEVAGHPKSRVGGDPPLSVHDLTDTPRWHPQITQGVGCIENEQLAESHPLGALVEPPHALPQSNTSGVPVPERPDQIDDNLGLRKCGKSPLVLSRNSHPKGYIDDCRTRVTAQVAACTALVDSARKAAGAKAAQVDRTILSFEPLFFNNMVLVLDISLCHRQRGLEGKDGNPLNEVKVLCTATLENHGILAQDKTIKMNPAKSISKYEVGDEIKLDARRFVQLSDAFFAEIEKKFG